MIQHSSFSIQEKMTVFSLTSGWLWGSAAARIFSVLPTFAATPALNWALRLAPWQACRKKAAAWGRSSAADRFASSVPTSLH